MDFYRGVAMRWLFDRNVLENESIQELPERSSPEPTLTAVPQITGSITATTPRAPGFGATLAIGILYTIYLFKRRYN